MAVSRGRTPWVMLLNLADEQMPWKKVDVFQIDERTAPPGDPDRNLVGKSSSPKDLGNRGISVQSNVCNDLILELICK